GPQPNPLHLGFAEASKAALQLWLICSTLAFLVAIPVGLLSRTVAAGARRRKKRVAITESPSAPLPSDRPRQPTRRHVLSYVPGVIVSAPFVAGAYGLFYGRLNLRVEKHSVRLPRLPRSFHGFRIAQLSDIHISAFMPEEQIRRYAEIANSLKPDLIVLTGDFVTWDPAAQTNVVRALSVLDAPHGVFGCLGNHEAWSGTKDSISDLFDAAGIRILRDELHPIVVSRRHV